MEIGKDILHQEMHYIYKCINRGYMSVLRSFSFLIVLSIASLAFFGSINAAIGQGCYSGLLVTVISSGTPSADGFTISINGMGMATTNSQGKAFIPLSEDNSGIPLSIEANKDEHGTSYSGSGGVVTACFNVSARQRYPVAIRIN
jgi:hypothetical protein